MHQFKGTHSFKNNNSNSIILRAIAFFLSSQRYIEVFRGATKHDLTIMFFGKKK